MDSGRPLPEDLPKGAYHPCRQLPGKPALPFLKTTSMDVVVLDVRMPGMNGLETLRVIKSRYENIQVILLTGNVAVTDGIEGIKSGAFDYLTKPVEIDHLFNKINQAYDMIQLEEEKRQQQEYRDKLEKKMVDTETAGRPWDHVHGHCP